MGAGDPAALVSDDLVLILLLKPAFKRFALAVPTARSSHRTLTPQWGGIAVIAATVGVTACALMFLPGLSEGTVARMGLVLGAALLLAAVGAVDDMRNLGAAPKLLGQAAAVAMVIAALPPDLRILPIVPVAIERALVFIGGIWFVNIVNFMDGIDWMLVAEVVPITLGVAFVGALGALPPEAAHRRPGAQRRHARLCALQPARRAALHGRHGQPADRTADRVAAAARRRIRPLGCGGAAASLLRGGFDADPAAPRGRRRKVLGGAPHALLTSAPATPACAPWRSSAAYSRRTWGSWRWPP